MLAEAAVKFVTIVLTSPLLVIMIWSNSPEVLVRLADRAWKLLTAALKAEALVLNKSSARLAAPATLSVTT